MKFYDNINDMFHGMVRAQLAADNRVLDWQSEISVGDHVVRMVEIDSDRWMPIFVEILDSMDWWVSKGINSPDDCENEEQRAEYLYEAGMYSQPHMKHYRSARNYSFIVPGGELGDVHVSTLLMPITIDVWNRARALGWRVDAAWLLAETQKTFGTNECN